MISKFFYYLENQKRHSVAYSVEEFLSSITLGIKTKGNLFDCKSKKDVSGFHLQNYKKNKEVKQ